MPRASGLILLIIFIGNHGMTRAASTFDAMNEFLDYAQLMSAGNWWGVAKKVLNTGQPPEDGIPEVMGKIQELGSKMNEGFSMLNAKMTEVMQNVIQRVPERVEYDSLIRQLCSYIVRIESLWRTFKGYQVKGKKFNEDTLRDFIKAVTSNIGDSARNTVDNMAALVAPGFTAAIQKSLWQAHLSVAADNSWSAKCGKKVTQQYKMYVINKMIVATLMRAFNMLTFSWAMLAIFNKKSYDAEIEQGGAQFVVHGQRILTAAKVSFGAASREIMSCDPPEHKYDVTYTTMRHLIWAIVIREDWAGMNSRCKLTCAETYFDWKSGRTPKPPFQQVSPPCHGIVDGCNWLGNAEVCLAPAKDSYYKWIKSDFGNLGNIGSCPQQTKMIRKGTKFFYNCDPCICTCTSEYPESNADQAMSLWPVTSDIEKNKVVIGMGFTKSSGMLRPKIQTAELGPGGAIVIGTEKLQAEQNFQYDAKASNKGGYQKIGDGDAVPMVRNKDFMFFGKNRITLWLDDVECEGKSVVTGVKFGCPDKECRKVQLEARCTPFDFKTGKLYPNKGDTKSVWMTPQTMKVKSPLYKEKRTKIEIIDPDEPGRCKLNAPISTVNQAVDLQRSAVRKTAGQHTIPGAEMIQTVSAKSPLSGVGMYYKGGEGCGGLIAFKLLGMDYAKHINPALTKQQMEHYEELAG